MPNLMRSVPEHVPEALAASNVGTWKTGRDVHHYVADEAAAALFGVDELEAAEGLPLTEYARAIHLEDREIYFNKINRSIESGGLFVIEYRTIPRPGVTRWVLARGRYERNLSTGEMQGRGIVIDITESKLDGHVEDRALFLEQKFDECPLERAVTLALETWHAVAAVEGPEGPILRRSTEALLLELGQALARRFATAHN